MQCGAVSGFVLKPFFPPLNQLLYLAAVTATAGQNFDFGAAACLLPYGP